MFTETFGALRGRRGSEAGLEGMGDGVMMWLTGVCKRGDAGAGRQKERWNRRRAVEPRR